MDKMVIKYEQPGEFLNKGGANNKEYANPDIDIRDYIVEVEPWRKPTENEVWLATPENYVVLKGPLKVVASSVQPKLEPPKHTSEMVTVPDGETVRFQDYYPPLDGVREVRGKGVNMGISPVSIPKPLQTAAITGVPSGGAGAVGGHYLIENPLVGIATAIVGGGAGYWWENSKYAEYGTERVK